MFAKKKQGPINRFRKLFLGVNIAVFVALWIFTKPLLALSYWLGEILETLGILLIFAGIMGRVFASFSIASRKNKVIVDGELYSVVRHPLYFFSLLMVAGVGLSIQRVELLAYLLLFFLACFLPMLRNEEKFLIEKFGQSYVDYKKRVPMLIPNFRKWKSDHNVSIDMPLVAKTLRDASWSLLIIPGVEVIEYIRGVVGH